MRSKLLKVLFSKVSCFQVVVSCSRCFLSSTLLNYQLANFIPEINHNNSNGKYWNDKKSFVKKKAAARSRARRQTGGGNVDVPELTEIEERIVTLMGGEGFAVGDTHLRIDPFESQNQDTESPSILARGLYEEPAPGTSGVLLEQPIDYTPDEIINIDNAERNNLNAIVDHGLEIENTVQNQEMSPETVPVAYIQVYSSIYIVYTGGVIK